MTTSSILVVPSIGAVRPFSDFVSASISFSATVRFSGMVPEKSGQPYGVTTTLEIGADAIIELRDVDKDGAAIIQPFPLFGTKKEFKLNSATTSSALNTLSAALPVQSEFLADDVESSMESTTPPAPPVLTFGDSPLFNEYVLGCLAEPMRNSLVTTITNLNRFFEMEEKAQRLRSSPTQIGEEGTAQNTQAAELAELENVLAKNRATHEARRQNILKFIGQSYLVLTDKGFEITRPTHQRPSGKDKEKSVTVPAIEPVSFTPDQFKLVVSNFVNDVVKHEPFKIEGDVLKFIDASVNNLVNAVKVQ